MEALTQGGVPPAFVECQIVGVDRDLIVRQLNERMTRLHGITWARFTYLPDEDVIVAEGWRVRPDNEGPLPTAAAMDETREHRPDETKEQQSAREVVEGHVEGVERAADRGLLNRRQADRLIGAGQKAHRSHDMARGITQKE